MILELVQDCREILKNEKEEIFLFFHLGQSVEQIDTFLDSIKIYILFLIQLIR
jgi:hypothetical protein